MKTSCPSCGHFAERYDHTTEWCESCVLDTLREQKALRYAPERHEVIEPA